jgi:hypothetical protein
VWVVEAVVGACCLGAVALDRGETINALWLMEASVSVFMIA